MIDVFRQMVQVQEQLNRVAIGQNWREQAPNFTLAMMQECAEGVDHLGWKWWTPQAIELQKAQLELVDIVHFALSELMLSRGNTGIPELIEHSYKHAFTTPVRVCARIYNLKGMKPIELFRLISLMSALGYVEWRAIVALSDALQLSDEGLARLYFSKAILNTFRQENGYKQGNYVKMWAEGKEDNEFLHAEASKLDFKKPDAPRKLRLFLEETYKGVTAKKPA